MQELQPIRPVEQLRSPASPSGFAVVAAIVTDLSATGNGQIWDLVSVMPVGKCTMCKDTTA